MRFLIGLLCLCCAAVTSQFPEFYQQYLQRIGGHLDQLQARTEEIAADARDKGLSTESYIESFLESEPHALEGQRMQESFQSYNHLKQAEESLGTAAIWSKPFQFSSSLHPGVASAALNHYKPAVPLSLEGLIYAAFGATGGWLLCIGLGRLIHRVRTIQTRRLTDEHIN